jgi:hypothetical protein
VTQYSLVSFYRHFGETCYLYIQAKKNLTLLPWRGRQHVPPSHRQISTCLHDVTTQQNIIFTVPAATSSTLTFLLGLDTKGTIPVCFWGLHDIPCHVKHTVRPCPAWEWVVAFCCDISDAAGHTHYFPQFLLPRRFPIESMYPKADEMWDQMQLRSVTQQSVVELWNIFRFPDFEWSEVEWQWSI